MTPLEHRHRAWLVGSLLLAATLCRPAPALAAETAAEDILGCDGEWAQSPLCVERRQALDSRAKIEAILATLAAVEQPPWPPADLATATALYDEGQALFRDEYFGDAAIKFAPVLAKLEAIQQEFKNLVATTRAGAEERMAAEEFTAALAGFRQVLIWLPDDEAARVGANRALDGQRLARVADEAIRHVEAGEPESARALLAEARTERPPARLREARRLLREFDRRMRVNALITDGHAAIDRLDWSGAAEAFRKALDIDPRSSSAKDGLAQSRRGAVEHDLAALRSTFAGQMAEESWMDAIATAQRVAALDPDAPEVREQLPELQRRAALEAGIDQALDDPRRAAAKSMREDTRTLIEQTRHPSEVGARIHAKGRELEQQLAVWTTPVALAIRSDNKTEVQVRPGRKLGKFDETNLDVYPGRYTLIGRRNGFREKKLEISVPPGSSPIVVELACDERF